MGEISRSIAVALGLAALLGCGAARRPERIGAWVTEWDLERGMESVARASLSDVFFFVARLDADGMPVLARPGVDYAAAVRSTRRPGATVWITVVNDVVAEGRRSLKDPETIHRILHDPSLRTRHISALLDLASANGFGGIDVDYENLAAGDREAFTRFIAELAPACSTRGLALSVTVQPKVQESRSDGPGAADWGALCGHVDRLQIMLYNLHNARTAPGPVATMAWIGRVLDFAETQCPRERLVPILKNSGFDWGADTARDATFERAISLATQHGVPIARETIDDVPTLSLTIDGLQRTVYFEDAASLDKKLCFLGSRGFDRAVFWSLGREDRSLWSTITRAEPCGRP